MDSIPFISDRIAPAPVAVRQSVNALMMRGLAASLDGDSDLADVLKYGDARDGTPFFFSLANEFLSRRPGTKTHLTHELACAIHDSFLPGEPSPEFVAEKTTDITLFPKRIAASDATRSPSDSVRRQSCCIMLRHKNMYVLGMTGYFHRYPDVKPQVCENYPLVRFAGQIEEALDVLQYLHAEIYDRVCGACTFVVPVGALQQNVYTSFTMYALPRMIFLPPSGDPLRTACAIGHEFAHYELNCLDRRTPLVLKEFSTVRCYSPWRDDPRHALALLHALYVFCEVSALLKRQLSNSRLRIEEPARLEGAERLLSLTRARLRQGLVEVQNSHLTSAGQQLLRQISGFVNEVLTPTRFDREMEERVHKEKLDRVALWQGQGT